jgi:glycosyltransferase involved in cell wall biosynthesis
MGDSLSIALLVHHQLEPGTGAPGSTLVLAEALRTRGHRVDVIGLEIVGTGESLWTHLRFPLAAARRVRRALRQHTYDIIDASTGDLWLLTRREIATSPTAVLTRSHGLEPLGVLARRDGARRRELTLRARYRIYHGGWRLHEVRRTLTCSDAVLVLNERERQYVASLGVDRDDIIRTAPLAGVGFSDAPDAAYSTTVAVLGGTQWRKGGSDNARFIAELLRSHEAVAVTWVGVTSKEIESLIPSDLAPRVRALPSYRPDETGELFRSHAVVVLLSRFEGLPLALLEAMSHGCVVVGTAIGGVEELASVSGGAVAVGDITSAVTAVTTALDASTWSELSRRSAQESRKFAPLRIVDILEDNYRRAIAAKAARGEATRK